LSAKDDLAKALKDIKQVVALKFLKNLRDFWWWRLPTQPWKTWNKIFTIFIFEKIEKFRFSFNNKSIYHFLQVMFKSGP